MFRLSPPEYSPLLNEPLSNLANHWSKLYKEIPPATAHQQGFPLLGFPTRPELARPDPEVPPPIGRLQFDATWKGPNERRCCARGVSSLLAAERRPEVLFGGPPWDHPESFFTSLSLIGGTLASGIAVKTLPGTSASYISVLDLESQLPF